MISLGFYDEPPADENMTAFKSEPLGVFFVSSGTKGDRLLFRYPYEIPQEKDDCNARKNMKIVYLVG